MAQPEISPWQMFNLTTAFVLGTTFIVLPTDLIREADQYGWLVQAWGTLFGVIVGALWLYVYSRFPNLSLVEISRRVLGKYVGGAVSLCYIFFFVQLASWVSRDMGDYMKINMMPKTPLSMFHILALVICAYAVIKGIDSISLVSALMVPFIDVAFWVPFTVMIREWDWQNFLYPSNFRVLPTLIETQYALGFPFMETVAFMMIFPLVRTRLKRSFLGGVAFSGLLLTLAVFFTIGILGVYRASHLTYPVYTIFREMQFSYFIEHLEAVISVIALFLVFIKLSILFYVAVSAICQLFRIENRGATAFALVWVISAYSLLFSNIIESSAWINQYLFIYYVPFGIGLPIVFLIGSWIRPAKARKTEATL
jgi:spore germination protein KB